MKGNKLHIRPLFLWLSLFCCSIANSQTPFLCKDQALTVVNGSADLAEIIVSPSNSASEISTLVSGLGVSINALGYCRSDNLLYGMDPLNHNLYQIDANGTVQDLGVLNVPPNLEFLAGDVHPDGQHYYVIGSSSGNDQTMIRIDLASPGFDTETLPFNGATFLKDIAFDPYTEALYGFDSNSRSMVKINLGTGLITTTIEIQNDQEIEAVYFDTFGRLLAYGSTIFGITGALFEFDSDTGEPDLIVTGPPYSIVDAASCPYSVELNCQVNPAIVFPCSEVEYVISIANLTGAIQNNIDLELTLPSDFVYLSTVQNSIGGILDATALPEVIRLEGLNINVGIDSVTFLVEVGDLPSGDYKSQAILSNLANSLGNSRVSDDPRSPIQQDSTTLEINRIEEDSLFFSFFLCLGESMTLDATDYGANIVWNTGATNSSLNVQDQGLYSLEATSGCQVVEVSYDITVATCPYTIAIDHKIFPKETEACNEVVYRFIVENDSGLARNGVSFSDYLPIGFSLIGIGNNPFGGNLSNNLPPNEIEITGMNIPVGIDSFDLIVEVGEVSPGIYNNRGILGNLPDQLGPQRFTDDPTTPLVDSTALSVLGLFQDSLLIDTLICQGSPMILDGSPYGLEYLWDDGSTADSLVIEQSGFYQLSLTGGCEPQYVFFDVKLGAPVILEIDETYIPIHQGDSVQIEPFLFYEGDSIFIEWNDPFGNSLSCLDCLEPIASPLHNTIYTITASNKICSAEDQVTFIVDDSRRIYAPNAFSPNFDGVNDYFYLQSPDPGVVHSLVIADRWGSIVFESNGSSLNDYSMGWDGVFKGHEVQSGVYIWVAELEFVDGIVDVFRGDVTVVR